MSALLLASCGDVTAPPPPEYVLTFDDGAGIYETRVDNGQISLIMRDSATTTYDISWSPDGRQVAFTRQYHAGGQYWYRVLVYDASNYTERVLTKGPDDSFQPAWSPDGSRVAYLSRPVDGIYATLRTIRPDGTDDRALGSLAYYVRPPRWSPNGRQIAATRSDLTVVIVDAATGSLGRAVAPGMSPTWSPDGQQLAFVADAGLTIANLAGGGTRVISGTFYDPAWSPDGKWVAGDGLGVYLLSASAIDTAGMRHIGPYARPAWRLRQ